MSNVTGLVDSYYFEEFRKVFEKHSFGSVTDAEKNYYEKVWEVAFSNLTKLTANVVFETSLKYLNDYDLIEKTKHKYPDIVQIEMLAIQVHNMKVNLETLQSSQFSRHPEFNKIKINLKEQIADLQTAVQLLADDKGININVKHDDLTTTLDKLVGQGYGKLFNESMDKLFKYNDYIKLVYNTFDEKLSSDTSKQVDYVKDVLNLSSKLSGGAFVDGSAGLLYGAKQGAISLSSIIQSEGLKHLESLAQKIPTISAKGVVGILSRGVITGILTDLSYKGGYAFGELVFKEGFKAVLGKELYEMENFITVMDSIYSFIFQDLTGDKLNAVIVFNTLLLGNFINAQGQSVITEDTTILLGSDDYKEMDFNKALKNYKAIYKLISGKDDADNISNEFSMLAHMEKSYELFKTLKGQKLIIAQNSDDIKAFSKIALEDSASSFAYRYAIVNLNLFVLEGIDYTKHNQNSELDLYSDTQPDGLTEIYLSKRAEMLSIILDKANGKFQTSQYSYQDLEKDIVINETSLDTRYGNVDVYNENTQIIFGGEDSDTITAEDIGDKHNFLFGGKGDDRISAGEGRDYLEGNAGNDVLEGGDGDDTLWGGTGNDRLYGDSITPDGILGFGESKGNDVLVGGQGNDTFYGGKGSDKLIDLEGVDMYNAKLKDTTAYYKPLFKMNGEDDIYDKDGRGLILLDDKVLRVGEKITDTLYYSNDKQYYIHLHDVEELKALGYEAPSIEGLDLTKYYKTDTRKYHVEISHIDTNKAIYNIWYWKDGDLGLKLTDPNDPQDPNNPNSPKPPFTPPSNPPTRSDPLVLDLNHDGKINTIHLSQGVHFDLDGNQFAEQSSWVDGHKDGFVVLDINNNGKIDNGGELFGTDTIISKTGHKATDGFMALAQYDSNGDKVIDRNDAIFHRLKIWQDKNKDGVSQANELKTLDEHNISHIGVEKVVHNKTDHNEVIHTYTGTFTQHLGDEVEKQGVATTLLFQINTAKTYWQGEQNDEGISEEIQALPDLMGYGTVKSLHQAMASDSTGTLKQLVYMFEQTPKAEQKELVEQILLHWTGKQQVATETPIANRINLQQFEVLKSIWGKETEWRGAGLHQFQNGTLELAYQQIIDNIQSQLQLQTTHRTWINLIEFSQYHIYEASHYAGVHAPRIISSTEPQIGNYYGVEVSAWKIIDHVWKGDFTALAEKLIQHYSQQEQQTVELIQELNQLIKNLDINHSQLYNDWIQQWAATAEKHNLSDLKTLIQPSIVTTQGNHQNDLLQGDITQDHITGNTGHDILIGGQGNDYLDGGMGNDTYVFSLGDGQDVINSYDAAQSKQDIIYFTQGIQPAQISLGRVDNNLIIRYSEQDQITVQQFFDAQGVTQYRIDQIQFADGTIWTADDIKDKVLQATEANDVIQGYASNDTLTGLGGNDTLIGHAGHDTLLGGIGHDTLNGNAGNDTLIGGVGNDRLEGGEGTNTYLFHLGDGQDTIKSYYQNKHDTIEFAQGITPAQVTLKRIHDSLVITYSEQDQITVQQFFDSQGVTQYRIDQIQFADGTIWTADNIKDKVLQATEANDVIQGYASDDTLTGLDGDDTLIGHAGHDTLIGGVGNDRLEGGVGNDTLIGGVGNDQLEGGEGTNTYLFHLGDGQDTINSSYRNKHDIIEFAQDITPEQVILKRVGNNLVIIYSKQDSVTVNYFFDYNGVTNYRIDQIQFANGTIWTVDDIKDKVLQATEANDVIQGYASNDTLTGLGGNDTLYGNAGHDTLIGGIGNDRLEGGVGNDSYVFSGDWGQDIIRDNTDNNKIHLEGINPDSLHLFRDGNDLIIKQLGTTNQITVYNQFHHQADGTHITSIQSITFDNGVIWDVNIIKQKTVIGTDENNLIQGLNDNDMMFGKGGNDTLYGNAGDDTLIGGVGNDTLIGGIGNDTYVFSGDWGQDIIRDNTDNNKIHLEGINPESLHLFRDGNDLIIKQLGTTNQITVYNQFHHQADSTHITSIQSITFDNGVIWDVNIIKQKTVIGTDENNLIQGLNDNDMMFGKGGNDTLYGNAGDDTLIGGTGNDRLEGGIGDDTYVFSGDWGQDIISDNTGTNQIRLEGVKPSEVYLYRDNTHLIIKQLGSENSIQIQHQFDDNVGQVPITSILFVDGTLWDSSVFKKYAVIGTPLNDVRYGFDGLDIMYGQDGDDTLYGQLDNDILYGGDGQDQLYGEDGNDTLYGENGNDTLDGGIGADRLIGGAGNDTYYVNELGDEVIENAEEGEDIVISAIDYTLTQHVENLTLVNNEQAITATGNTLNNIIIGNALDNTLDGQAGIDTMIGGTGNDTYYVDNSQDIIIEQAGEGNDHIIASSDYTLSAHIENLTLVDNATIAIGNDHNNIIIGNQQANHLEGGRGDDSLNGGLGADTMIGGLDNDTYYVDNILDRVVELTDEGYDTIISRVDYTLSQHVEHLILEAGSKAIYATGNELNNFIEGNEHNNIIDGGAGADRMNGGAGNDYYIVDHEFDQVLEHFSLESGIDTVEQHIDRPFYDFDEFGNTNKTGSYHLLFNNVENLILKGTAKTAFGNDLDNIITLNEQNNFVNALSGNDTIIYQKGGGKDTIVSTDRLESMDTLVIEGYEMSEAMFVRVTNTASPHDMLQIRFKGTNDQITLLDYFASDMNGQNNRIDEITFKKGEQMTTLSQSEFETKIFAQTNNHAPQVNKYPKPIQGEIGKVLSMTFDKDTIKDIDPYDSELSYRLTLASKGADGQYEALPSWLSFDPATLTLTGTPPQEAKGNLQLILWGEDSFNHSAGTYVNLTIVNATVAQPISTLPSAPIVTGDTIKDTKGNDTLKGTIADNTFIYTGGVDTITDKGGYDTLVFGDGITFNQVGQGLMMSGNDLVLRVNGSSANQVTLKDFFADRSSIVETISFETGGQIDYKQIYGLFGKTVPIDLPILTTDDTTTNPTMPSVSLQNNFVGTAKADKLTGTQGNDQLQGLAGADTLNAKDGNDILIGGIGNDTLIGGSGDDLYFFVKGFGRDTIINTGGGYDNIYFDGISFNQIGQGLTRQSNNLILKVKGGTDELTLKDFFLGGDNASLNIHFKDGGSITNTQLLNAFKSSKTPTHSDSQGFNQALEASLALMEEFKHLTTDTHTPIL